MTTQSFLNQAYDGVVKDLVKQMTHLNRAGEREYDVLEELARALDLDGSAPPRSLPDSRLTSIALRPLAQLCVVAVLRNFLTGALPTREILIPEGELLTRLKRIGAGVVDSEADVSEIEATIAIKSTWNVLSELLRSGEIELAMDGETFSLSLSVQGLHIQRVSEVKRSPSNRGDAKAEG